MSQKYTTTDIQDVSLKLIAPCGMNCALCIGYQRKKNQCSGCNHGGRSTPGSCNRCSIVNCELRKQTKSGFCYECPKYPCARMKQLDKRYRTKYRMSMLDNLEYIKIHGLDAFVRYEKKRWTCEKCGNLVSVHRLVCQYCGTDSSGHPD